MVTQEAYLFSGTVADNIALGKPDATLEEIKAAARAVGADGLIDACPTGTPPTSTSAAAAVGGTAPADLLRARLPRRPGRADPRQATASFDIPSERQIQNALQTLLADRTAIIIAHRLSTVAIADRVLVMEHGEIIEDDAPDVLIAGTGKFAKLHAARRESLV